MLNNSSIRFGNINRLECLKLNAAKLLKVEIKMNKIIDLVMLVDDDEATNFYHNIMIEESEITDNIIICRNAQEAIDKIGIELDKNEIQTVILFLDINMPMIDGWSFLESISDLEKNQMNKLKIVMVSASEYPKDLERIKNHPLITVHMPKPLESEKVRSFALGIKN